MGGLGGTGATDAGKAGEHTEGWKVAKGLNIIVHGVHLRAETLTEQQAEWAVKIGVPEKFISKIKED